MANWKKYFLGIYVLLLLGQCYIFFKIGLAGLTYLTYGLFLATIGIIIHLVLYAFLKGNFLSPNLKTNISLTVNAVLLTFFVIEGGLRGYRFAMDALEGNMTQLTYNSQYAEPEGMGWYYNWDTNGTHELPLKGTDSVYKRKTNNEGLPDKDFEVDKKPNEFRIISMGDSFTEGDGAPPDSSWVKLLKDLLNKQYQDITFSNFNAGVIGNDPYFNYMMLKGRLLKYNPDLVIATVNRTDIWDILKRGEMDRFRPNGELAYNERPWWEWFYGISQIHRRFLKEFFGYDHLLLTSKMRKQKQKEALNGLIDLMEKFRQLGQQHEFPFMVVFHPLMGQVKENHYRFTPIIDSLKEKQGIHTVDMLDLFVNQTNMTEENLGRYYWLEDGHHTPKGYLLFAKLIQEELHERNLLPDTSSTQRITEEQTSRKN